jgi:hypothetical protein
MVLAIRSCFVHGLLLVSLTLIMCKLEQCDFLVRPTQIHDP